MVSRIGRLALSIFLAAVTMGPAAHAQPVPRGREVVVDPEASDVSYCPLLARQEDGSVAVAWSRHYDFPSRVLARTFNPQGELGPVTSIEQDSDAILIVLGSAAVQTGFHVLWYRFGGAGNESLWSADLDTQARLIRGPRLLRNLPFHSRVFLWPRPVGGFVETSWSSRAVFVRLLADDLRPIGDIQRVPVPLPQWAPAFHQADGGFIVLIQQDYLGAGIRAQRFDAEGRPAGPLLRLLPPNPNSSGLLDFDAAVAEDGTLAVTAQYSFFFRAPLIVLQTFDADGSRVGLRTQQERHEGLSTEAVSIDPEGRVLWVWYDISLGRYEARVSSLDGQALSPVFHISTRSDPGSLLHCANAAWAGDDWVVTWIMAAGKDARSVAYIRRFAR